MIQSATQRLIQHENLTELEARDVMNEIMEGRATDAQLAAFLIALRMKGETPEELVGFARTMREKAEPFWDENVVEVLDTCGTGGDGSNSFNISTAAAFVVAGTGIRVAKHGNRSMTSLCGSADVMEALGIDIQMPMEQLRRAVRDVGIGFLFAQRFHTSMKHVGPVRKQIGVRTVFNVLGPLSNPAAANFQVVGVFSPDIMERMAGALRGLGLKHAFVVHGADGVDEISITGPTTVFELRNGEIISYTIHPEQFGITPACARDLTGGDAVANARIIESVLGGERGARRDVVLLNAAAALVAGGVAPNIKDGVLMGADSIDSGRALGKLKALRELK